MLVKTTGWITKRTSWFSNNQLKQFLINCFLDFYICDSALNFIIPSKFEKIFHKQFTPLLFKAINSNTLTSNSPLIWPTITWESPLHVTSRAAISYARLTQPVGPRTRPGYWWSWIRTGVLASRGDHLVLLGWILFHMQSCWRSRQRTMSTLSIYLAAVWAQPRRRLGIETWWRLSSGTECQIRRARLTILSFALLDRV